eukprot:UN15320
MLLRFLSFFSRKKYHDSNSSIFFARQGYQNEGQKALNFYGPDASNISALECSFLFFLC